MNTVGNISANCCKEYLDAHIINKRIEAMVLDTQTTTPSIFYFQEGEGPESISLNVAFRTLSGLEPTTIILSPMSKFQHNSIQSRLFGEKSFTWITKVLQVLDGLKLKTKSHRANSNVCRKLKCLSIVLNIVTRNLMEYHSVELVAFLKHLVGLGGGVSDATNIGARSLSNVSLSDISFDDKTLKRLETSRLFQQHTIKLMTDLVQKSGNSQVLAVGLPLLLSIWQVFECQISETVGSEILRTALVKEQATVISAIATLDIKNYYENFVKLTSKRLQVTLFLLCDAIGFDDNLIDKNNTVEKIHHLGSKLELLHAGSHDISKTRLERGLERLNNKLTREDPITKTNNMFLFWLNTKKQLGPLEISSLCSTSSGVFSYDNIKPLIGEFWAELPHSSINEIEFLIKGDVLEKATLIYKEYYDINWLE